MSGPTVNTRPIVFFFQRPSDTSTKTFRRRTDSISVQEHTNASCKCSDILVEISRASRFCFHFFALLCVVSACDVRQCSFDVPARAPPCAPSKCAISQWSSSCCLDRSDMSLSLAEAKEGSTPHAGCCCTLTACHRQNRAQVLL